MSSKFDAAEQTYLRILDADAAYIDAYLDLAWLYRWQPGRHAEMLDVARQAAQLSPDLAQAHAALAVAHLLNLDLAQADKAAQRAIELEDASVEAQVALAEVALLDARFDVAVRAAERAVNLAPRSALAAWALGRVYRGTARYVHAEAAFLKALTLEPEFSPWYVELADLYLLLEQDDDAEIRLSCALELHPDSVPALALRARRQIDQGHYKDAHATIDRIMELAPSDVLGHLLHGDLTALEYEPLRAIGDYHKALLLTPTNWHVNLKMGHAYLHSANCTLAERHFSDALAAHPRFAEARLGRGLVELECKGNKVGALSHLRQATEANPYLVEAWHSLGRAYLATDNVDQSLKSYVRALQVSPNPAQIHAQLGDAYLDQGETDSARSEFQAALRLRPALHDARRSLAYIYLNQGEATPAIAELRDILQGDPNDLDALLLLGIALLEDDNSEEAVTALKSLISKRLSLASAHYHLARAYRNLGQYDQARAAMDSYLALEKRPAPMVYSFYVGLQEGYVIDKADALDVLDTILQDLSISYPVRTVLIDVDGRSIIDLAMSVSALDDQDGVLYDMAMGLSGAAALVPHIEPMLDGGVRVRAVTADGALLHTLELSYRNARDFSDGWISAQNLWSWLVYTRGKTSPRSMDDLLAREIEAAVAELRELDFVETVSYRLDLADYMARQKTESDFKTMTLLLRALGILSPDDNLAQRWDALDAAAPVGVYVPQDGVLYVDDGPLMILEQIRLIYAYTRALQEQHFDIDSLDAAILNVDQQLACWALIEGDAALTMFLYANERTSISEQLLLRGDDSSAGHESLDELDTFLSGLAFFSYDQGSRFVNELYERGGWKAINQAYANPPRSTEQILHPERYLRSDEPVEISLPQIFGAIEPGWKLVDEGVLGELRLRLMLARHIGPAAAAIGAEDWGGDRYALLHQADGDEYAFVLRVAFDDLDQAAEFWSIYGVFLEHRPDLVRQVNKVISDPSSMWWNEPGGPGALFATRTGEQITIVAASHFGIANQIVKLLALTDGSQAQAWP